MNLFCFPKTWKGTGVGTSSQDEQVAENQIPINYIHGKVDPWWGCRIKEFAFADCPDNWSIGFQKVLFIIRSFASGGTTRKYW
mmetsp:Transcript_37956/g.92016  ORF Transcript_37956/g.92016 Transcript_37956/m.92016 type:complete len:83 (+) Transcript_37956:142-390(+)